MNKASPILRRKALEIANAYTKAGLLFMPMPVADEAEFKQRAAEADARLEQMAIEAEQHNTAS